MVTNPHCRTKKVAALKGRSAVVVAGAPFFSCIDIVFCGWKVGSIVTTVLLSSHEEVQSWRDDGGLSRGRVDDGLVTFGLRVRRESTVFSGGLFWPDRPPTVVDRRWRSGRL
jgi:hypothetical protein